MTSQAGFTTYRRTVRSVGRVAKTDTLARAQGVSTMTTDTPGVKRWSRPLPRTLQQMREHPEHDAHVVAWEETLWRDWPPEVPVEVFNEAAKILYDALTHDDLYVIACSNSTHNLYWTGKTWSELADAEQFNSEQRVAHEEPIGGFWMPLVRAQELEE